MATGRPITNKLITLNGKEYATNYVLSVSESDDLFIYVINAKKLGYLKFVGEVYSELYLRPILTRVTKVLRVEIELKKERDLHMKQIKNRIIYVNNATMAMHFLRNKFSPIKAHFEMLDVIDDKQTDPLKLEGIKAIAEQNRRKIKVAIQEILQRTNQILEKPENPFLITEINKTSLRKIFTIIVKNWTYYFEVESINMQWKVDFEQNIYFSLNEEYFEILINDCIQNMSKYEDGYHALNFAETPEYYNIYFVNNYKRTESKEEMDKMVHDFNSPDDTEMSRRTSHGLAMMKSFLKQMRIIYNLRLEDDNRIVLKLSFKKEL
ncbi:hypothetical protein GCM10028786_24840 [Flaviaesturariibacter terrae]